MLVRAARRKVRRDAAKLSPVSVDKVPLACLYSAISARRVYATSVVPASSHENWRQRPSAAIPGRKDIRPLATASDAFTAHHDTIPFRDLPKYLAWDANRHSIGRGVDLSGQFDPQQPLIIDDSSFTGKPRIPKKDGLGGDPAELHQNLHACLRIGRLDRAASLVQRLTEVYSIGSLEVTLSHNLYLRALFRSVDGGGLEGNLQEMRDWFENKLLGQDVMPDVDTFVIMLRASIASLEGPDMDKAVLELLDKASQYGVYEEVMLDADFGSREWATLLRLQPNQFNALTSADEQLDQEISAEAESAIYNAITQPPTATVKPVAQKGLGLVTLHKSLAVFNDLDHLRPEHLEMSESDQHKAIQNDRQLRLEEDAVNAAAERWRAESESLEKLGVSQAVHKKSLSAVMWQWLVAMRPLVQNELEQIHETMEKKSQGGRVHLSALDEDRLMYGPFLKQFDADTLATITIITALTSVGRGQEEAYGQRISVIATKIGSLLEDELEKSTALERMMSASRIKTSSHRAAMLARLSKKRKFRFRAPKPIEQGVSPSLTSPQDATTIPAQAKAKLGAVLIEKLLQAATLNITRQDPETSAELTATVPAFSHSHSFLAGKKVGVLAIHHELHSRLRKEPVKGSIPSRLPMLVEPKPWTGFKDGGFLRYTVPVVRLKGSQRDQAQVSYATSAIAKGDMATVLAGLDVLGQTPWRINRNVFEVMLEAWNSGEPIGELAPEHPVLPLPEEPKEGDLKARLSWANLVKEIEAKKAGYHSQRCFQNFQLEIAKSYLDETFYYPHNLDFRGRAYPIPQLLNHMGADMARGLLIFGRGKALGSVGLRWLKVHLANLYGYDKASFKEREEFTMEHLDDIYDSAINPLSGRRWWLKGEDPWQLLGACFELKAALDSPDPTQYESHLPVHQDGTCNGLQHYAALGGDKVGASQVNLEPGDRPADIYTGVAELVKEEVKGDAAEGNPAAMLLNGKITRKVVKQTVMTNVYGVTFNGATKQVLRQLDDIYADFQPTEDVPRLSILASYITRKIFRALSSMFTGAHDIQYWLGECAQRISTSFTPEQIDEIDAHLNNTQRPKSSKFRVSSVGSTAKESRSASTKDVNKAFRTTVIWTTPLKMPVVQPYRSQKTKVVKTCLQNVNLAEPTTNEPVSKRKQLQAFPPNFIHSLDATHMTLSALKCHELGLTFAAVHDSFWTHAADITVLNTVLRDAFVRMHSEDIIGRLAAEFKARYSNNLYLASVSLKSEAGKQISEWRQAMKTERQSGNARSMKSTTYWELLLEKKRADLLKSSDPEKRKEGEAMVTPASIYEAANASAALSSSPNLHTLLGDVTGTKAAAAEKELAKAESEAAASEEEGKFHQGNSGKAAISGRDKVQLWLPLTFPAVPKKGDFDVKRLKNSQYFFS